MLLKIGKAVFSSFLEQTSSDEIVFADSCRTRSRTHVTLRMPIVHVKYGRKAESRCVVPFLLFFYCFIVGNI